MSTAEHRTSDNLPAVRHSVSEIRDMAKAVAASRLFGMDESQAMTMMLLAQAKGIHPIQAVERYHVIKGKPAMKADAMLADFLAHGGTVEWHKHDHTACSATFTAPGVKTPVTVTWTMEDAKKALLTASDMYTKYPRQMLRSRVISEAIRMVMPGIVAGIYTPEEVGDFDNPVQTNARVVDSKPLPRPGFTNNTGNGTGKYASPEAVKKYQSWLKSFTDEVCQKWLDHWTGQHGELPNGIGDLVNPGILSHYLCKAGREAGLIEAPEDFKVGQTDKLVAILHERDPESLIAEARAFCRKLWAETKAKFEAGISGFDPADENQDEGTEGEEAEAVVVGSEGASDDSREG